MQIPKHDDKDIFHRPSVKMEAKWTRRDAGHVFALWLLLLLIVGFCLMDLYLGIHFWEGASQ
jgi:hypothetical protein